MSTYTEFFLNSAASVVPLETIEISHPSFSKTYYIVRNAISGITATLEDSTAVTFDYYPLAITVSGAANDLDQTLTVDLGDLGDTVPNEIDRCFNDDTVITKPSLVYRVFRSDDLSAPIDGPFRYEITSLAQTRKGASFAATAPRLNTTRTGEVYAIGRFPMMAGFL